MLKERRSCNVLNKKVKNHKNVVIQFSGIAHSKSRKTRTQDSGGKITFRFSRKIFRKGNLRNSCWSSSRIFKR